MNTLDCNLKIAEDFGIVINFEEWHLSKTSVYKVLAYALNVRSSPSIYSPVVGGLKYGDTVVVQEVVDYWAKIGEDRWVSMNHLVEVAN